MKLQKYGRPGPEWDESSCRLVAALPTCQKCQKRLGPWHLPDSREKRLRQAPRSARPDVVWKDAKGIHRHPSLPLFFDLPLPA